MYRSTASSQHWEMLTKPRLLLCQPLAAIHTYLAKILIVTGFTQQCCTNWALIPTLDIIIGLSGGVVAYSTRGGCGIGRGDCSPAGGGEEGRGGGQGERGESERERSGDG